jgi:hypothetical protein
MGLSLRQARLCLDCDCLTDEMTCPWCDRDGTIPIAGWFRPMEERKVDAPRHPKGASTPPARRWILIVQHDQRDLYRTLRQVLAGTDVEVLYERRVGQRRRAVTGTADERRRTDRRRPRPGATVYRDSTADREPERPPRPSGDRETERVVRPPRRRHSAPV